MMPKDEYFMLMVDMLANFTTWNAILSFMDGHSGFNQIFISKDNVSKTAFRSSCLLGTYE